MYIRLDGGQAPSKKNKLDRGYDAKAASLQIKVVNQEPLIIYDLGFALQYDPEDMNEWEDNFTYIDVVSKSSIGLKTNLILSNAYGVIDGGYIKNLKAVFKLTGYQKPSVDESIECYLKDGDDSQLVVEKDGKIYEYKIYEVGQEVCQILFNGGQTVNFKTKRFLDRVDHRDGGFGSTTTKDLTE